MEQFDSRTHSIMESMLFLQPMRMASLIFENATSQIIWKKKKKQNKPCLTKKAMYTSIHTYMQHAHILILHSDIIR